MAIYLLIALGQSAQTIDVTVTTKVTADNYYKIEPGKWLLNSAATTSKAVAESLGLPNGTETYFITPVRGYYGRTQPAAWEWLAAQSAKTNA